MIIDCLIDKDKDNVHIADFFLNCSSQRCNELFWQCNRKQYFVYSLHYQIRGDFAETWRCVNFLNKLNFFMLANNAVHKTINLQRKLMLQLINLS